MSTETSLFKKAERKQAKLRLALTGPAGSGKTFSALQIARGLVGPNGKIAVIDTENGSAALYAGRVVEGFEKFGSIEFDMGHMNPPYLISKYIKALKGATEAEYDCVVVDSLSHAWAGEGGVLQRKEALDLSKPNSNTYMNWAKMTPEQNTLVSAILNSKIHVICTMRSKTEYVISDNEKGKKTPTKVGMAPIQREGFDYEFDVCLDLSANHVAEASKDRSSLFDGQVFTPSFETGEKLAEWLSPKESV